MMLAGTGCGRRDTELNQRARAAASLAATTTMLGDAWLNGSVSGTFTQTALERLFQLIEQERRALATSPQQLIDPRAERIAKADDDLSRILVHLAHAVQASDPDAARE